METTLITDHSDLGLKSIRVRSVAYPSNTIEHCVELTSSIFKYFGFVFASRLALAKTLDVSESHLQTQLSSCVQYGLLELRSKEGYRHTPLFTKIYKPLPTEKKEDALLEAFKSPELYKAIIKEHNQETLTANGLSIILFRSHRVAEPAAPLASKIFIENAKALGLMNSDNFFSVDGRVSIAEPLELSDDINGATQNKRQEEAEIIYLPPANKNNNESQKKYDFPPIPIFVDDEGSVAEVYLPKGFNKEHISRVIKVLKAQIE